MCAPLGFRGSRTRLLRIAALNHPPVFSTCWKRYRVYGSAFLYPGRAGMNQKSPCAWALYNFSVPNGKTDPYPLALTAVQCINPCKLFDRTSAFHGAKRKMGGHWEKLPAMGARLPGQPPIQFVCRICRLNPILGFNGGSAGRSNRFRTR